LTKWSCAEAEELYELTWRPAAEGVFAAPVIDIKQAQRAAAAQQPAKAAAYVPPNLRNQPQLVQKPRYREAYEPPSNVKAALAEPQVLSKAAAKNKKKREAKARKKEQGGDENSEVSDVTEKIENTNIR